MAPARANLLCRFSMALAVCAGGLGAWAVAPARAGTYEVPACDAAPGGANNSWTRSATLGMATSTACPIAVTLRDRSGNDDSSTVSTRVDSRSANASFLRARQ